MLTSPVRDVKHKALTRFPFGPGLGFSDLFAIRGTSITIDFFFTGKKIAQYVTEIDLFTRNDRA